jgi:hypothetical protein
LPLGCHCTLHATKNVILHKFQKSGFCGVSKMIKYLSLYKMFGYEIFLIDIREKINKFITNIAWIWIVLVYMALTSGIFTLARGCIYMHPPHKKHMSKCLKFLKTISGCMFGYFMSSHKVSRNKNIFCGRYKKAILYAPK